MSKHSVVDSKVKEQMREALGLDQIADKTACILDLMDKGVDAATAHKLATGKPRLPHTTRVNIERKWHKWQLASPKMQKLAHNAAKAILKGNPIISKTISDEKEYINVINPKASDMVAVIDMVTKRTEPYNDRQAGGDINLFIDNLNVAHFQGSPQDIVVGHSDNVAPLEISNVISELPEME